jgi:hypothetical protein
MGGGKGGGGVEGLDEIAKVQEKLGMEQAQMAREYLDFSKQQYAENQEFANQILDVQLPAMKEQLQSAREDRERYEKVFAPLEDQFAKEAKDYDSPERQAAEAAKAEADVAAGQAAARSNAAAALESFGVDPSTTRASAIDAQLANQNAISQAAAGNQARTRVEDTGRAMRTQAINVGRGFPGQSAAGYGGAVGTGGAAIGTQGAAGAARNAATGTAQGFYGGATNALQGAAQTRGQVAELQGQTPWLDAAAGVGGAAIGGWLARAEGGLAGDPSTAVPPNPDDNVPTMLNEDEYVIPKDVVMRKGTEFFDRFVSTTRRKAVDLERAA